MKLIVSILVVIAVVSIAANVLLYYRWSDRRPVVMFDNNDTISKIEYENALDASSKGAVLKDLLYRKIILDAANKKNVLPTQADIDNRYAQILRQSPQMLKGDGSDPTDVKDNKDDIEATLALENLRFRGIGVSDTEMQTYYNSHIDEFRLPTQSLAVLVLTKTPVDTAKAVRLLTDQAKPEDIAQYPGLAVSGVGGYNLDLTKLPQKTVSDIESAVYTMPLHSVKTFALPVSANVQWSLSVRNEGRKPEILQPLSAVLDTVKRDVENEKAPSSPEELAYLYQHANVRFGVEKYASYFDDIRSYQVSKMTASQQASAQPIIDGG